MLTLQRTRAAADVCWDDVHAALGELLAVARGLIGLADAKLDALRRADTAALSSVARDEARELAGFFRCEERVSATLAEGAQSPRESGNGSRRVSELASDAPEPARSRILAICEGLRAAMKNLQEKNRRAADVARGLHSHIRAIFADVAKLSEESASYVAPGTRRQTPTRHWVDAVG